MRGNCEAPTVERKLQELILPESRGVAMQQVLG